MKKRVFAVLLSACLLLPALLLPGAMAHDHIDSGEGYVLYHDYVAPTETRDGTTGPGTCSVCGEVVVPASRIPMLETQRTVNNPPAPTAAPTAAPTPVPTAVPTPVPAQVPDVSPAGQAANPSPIDPDSAAAIFSTPSSGSDVHSAPPLPDSPAVLSPVLPSASQAGPASGTGPAGNSPVEAAISPVPEPVPGSFQAASTPMPAQDAGSAYAPFATPVPAQVTAPPGEGSHTPVPARAAGSVYAPSATPVPPAVVPWSSSNASSLSAPTQQPDLAPYAPAPDHSAGVNEAGLLPSGTSGSSSSASRASVSGRDLARYPVFSSRFPWRRLRMNPQPGILIRLAGRRLWPLSWGDSPLLNLLQP